MQCGASCQRSPFIQKEIRSLTRHLRLHRYALRENDLIEEAVRLGDLSHEIVTTDPSR
jgi:hypothetical protein